MMRRPTPTALPHQSASTSSSSHHDLSSATKPDRPRNRRTVEAPQLLDMATVAKMLATSVRHIQRLVSERRIPYLKVGHFIRFDEQEIVAWLDERRVQVHVSSYERQRRR